MNTVCVVHATWQCAHLDLLAVGANRFALGRSYYVGLAILVVLMGIALVKAYRMWEEIHDVIEPDSPAELLKTFEEARDVGELDKEEFERVRLRLMGSVPDKNERSPREDQGAGPTELP